MLEPPINRDMADLDPEFRRRLTAVLAELAAEGVWFKLHEGFRTVARQQWLYGQGRPNERPSGRRGIIVTEKDGSRSLSNHQGTGQRGTGRAADCYPLDEHGRVTLSAPDAIWRRYAEIAEKHGLTAGYRWTKPHDPPHVELR